jgi:electron transport complex protein RnfE
VFGLYLGICSTLAVSTSINNALGMGLAVTAVLILSNMLVSSVRNITPDEIPYSGLHRHHRDSGHDR